MNRIKDLRIEKNISQAELAEMVDSSQGAISKYELNQRKIPGLVLVRLCDLFDCSADYLLGLSDERKATPAEIAGNLPDVTKKLLEAIPEMDIDDQQLMWNLIQTIKSKRGES